MSKPAPASPELLVVDDDEILLNLIVVSLQRAGYRVHQAANGRQALAIASNLNIDLVITDILMPEMEGIEFIGRLREERPSLKVLAISGGGSVAAEQCLKLAASMKATRVLEKPFPVTTLVGIVRDLVPPPPLAAS